jgi:hypothetical protein
MKWPRILFGIAVPTLRIVWSVCGTEPSESDANKSGFHSSDLSTYAAVTTLMKHRVPPPAV